ncbi:hypothetical protein PVAND_004342 [Polypedilum vanderplanki]|uniref:Uncharacterized protein n=1 Tax=Polypedilum vanderplanki TaxID=319348 RepID=A0A9J6BXE9_POLVA|nr:hypothetical protein PVAND_004342 [Polypedilum vanderplanki]
MPFVRPSHFLMLKVFIEELLNKGHEVTAITTLPYNDKTTNYTEILIDPAWNPSNIILKDNQNDPLSSAMYWIEYVVRTNGAKHLKSHAINLPFYQYFLLDVIGFIFLIIWLIWMFVKMLKKLLLDGKAHKEKLS